MMMDVFVQFSEFSEQLCVTAKSAHQHDKMSV